MESVNYTSKRYALLLGFSAWFILFSFLLRIVFLFWQLDEIDLSIINLLKILFIYIMNLLKLLQQKKMLIIIS